MRCSKSCYLYDLEFVDLFDKSVIEQVLLETAGYLQFEINNKYRTKFFYKTIGGDPIFNMAAGNL